MKSGVYKIENLANRKCYLGSAKDISRRWSGHVYCLNKGNHHCQHLQAAWKKYGVENFIFEIIEYYKKSKIIEREQYYINFYLSKGIILYNTCLIAGSREGIPCSEETKQKISDANKGHSISEETRKKKSLARMGHLTSDATREKMSNSKKGIPQSEEHKRRSSEAKKGKPTGISPSEETRKKMSDAKKGRTSPRKGVILSEEIKDKISASKTGKISPKKGKSTGKPSPLKGRPSGRKGLPKNCWKMEAV